MSVLLPLRQDQRHVVQDGLVGVFVGHSNLAAPTMEIRIEIRGIAVFGSQRRKRLDFHHNSLCQIAHILQDFRSGPMFRGRHPCLGVALIAPAPHPTARAFVTCLLSPTNDLELASREVHLESLKRRLEASRYPPDGVARCQRPCGRGEVSNGVELRDFFPVGAIRVALWIGCSGRRTSQLSLLLRHEFLRHSTWIHESATYGTGVRWQPPQ